MSELTPKKVFNNFQNDTMDKNSAINYLRVFIENSNDGNTRVEALEFLSEINQESEVFYKFLENLLVSDSNELIRKTAAGIIIKNYLNKGENVIKWAIANEKSIDCLLLIFRSLESANNEKAQSLIHLMEEKIAKKFIDNFSIKSREAMGLGFLDKLVNQGGFDLERDPKPAEPLDYSYAFFDGIDGHVTDIDIFCVNIPKILFLDFFPFLKWLYITNSSLKEIEGLEELIYLEVLDFHCNKLESIFGLEKLVHLKRLIIDGNPITRLEGIEELEDLTEIWYDETDITDNEVLKLISLVNDRRAKKIRKEYVFIKKYKI